MRLWPFRKAEQRSSTFEGLVTDAVVGAALGATGTPSPDALAAVETAAGWVGRCFAVAEVSGDRYGMVSARVLEMIGRELVRRGEAVFAIEGETMPRLTPCGTWDIRGTDNPRGWWYRVDSFGASMHRTRLLPGSSVVHPRINPDPVRPWQGRSPVRVASATSATAASAERSALAEARLPSGRMLPMPIVERADRLGFQASIREGGLHVVRSSGQLVGEREPRNRWEPAAYQPAPAATHVELRRDAARDVLSACGIPAVLFDVRADGASRREAYREVTASTLAPWGRLVEAELRDKLDSPDLALSFKGLHGADLASRGRALKQLVESNVPLAEAMAITGLGE